jgi:hypothetical protein
MPIRKEETRAGQPAAQIDSLSALVPVRASQSSLRSVPDEGTKLDLKKADKARQLAEYVLAQGGPSAKQAQVSIQLDGTKYTVWVSREAKPALMTISITPDGSWNAITLTDIGLDGRVNGGVLPAGLNPAKKKDLIFSDSLAAPWGAKPEGLGSRAAFQKLYDSALDALLKSYVSK